MNTTVIKRLIRDNELWVEECPAVPQTGILLSYAFMRQNRHLSKICQKHIMMLYSDDYIYEISLVREKDSVFAQLKSNIGKDKKYLNRVIAEWKKATDELYSVIKTDVSKLNNKQLAEHYKALINLLADSWSYPIIGEGCDPYSTNLLIPKIREELSFSNDEARETALTLTKSITMSFLDEEKLSLLSLALLKKHDSANFKRGLQKHVRNYYWIKNNYLETTVLDERYFVNEIDELAALQEKKLKSKIEEMKRYDEITKKQKKQIYKRYNLSADLKLSIGILETMAWWIDQRKIVMLRGFHAIFSVLDRISRNSSYTLHELKYATDKEIYLYLAESMQISSATLNSRKKCFFQLLDEKEIWTSIEGKEALQIKEQFMQIFKADEIKGLTASLGSGSITAEVSVINNVSKDTFKPNTVLVTSMTRPEFVPLMRKAAAIVTDEGGITCHAAIVSRELNIPCIIGTKVATKMLKTGDKVLVDVKNGSVKKL